MTDVLPNPPKALPEPDKQLGQALLFSPDIEKVYEIAEAENPPRYTAERLKAKRPEAYAAIILHLGAGKPGYIGLERIAKMMGVHHLTVAAVRDAEPEAVDMVRLKMVTKFRTAWHLQVDRILENPGLVPPNAIGIVLDILTRNIELMEGRPTSRHETVEREPVHDNFEAWVRESLPSERTLQAHEVREIPSPRMGLDEPEISPIGPPPPPALADRESAGPAQAAPEASTSSSTDPAAPRPEQDDQDREPEPERASAAADGRGGGSPASSGPVEPMDHTARKFSDSDSESI